MKKKLKIFLIVLFIGIVVGLSVVYYIFNMPHRDVKNEKPSYTIEASLLFEEYNNDENASNTKFANKVLQVSGEIVEISIDEYQVSITLVDEMEGVNCALDSMTIVKHRAFIDELKINDKITLKGKCDGFDMIMGVVLTRCFIIK